MRRREEVGAPASRALGVGLAALLAASTHRLRIALALLAATAALAPSAAALARAQPSARRAVEYVGRTEGSRAAIGISVEGRDLVAYVCDGIAKRGQTIGEWFHGRITGGQVRARSKRGARLVARVASVIRGTVTLRNGRTLRFAARRARGRARFIWDVKPARPPTRLTDLPRKGRFLLGWIRPAAGRERWTQPPPQNPCKNLGNMVKALVLKFRSQGFLDNNDTMKLDELSTTYG